MLAALIFDVDGTLADTEMAHLAAFNHAFAVQGMDWNWDVPLYTELLEISGGKERILHYWRRVQPQLTEIDGRALQAEVDQLHAIKTAAYEEAVLSGAVQLRPGALELMAAADHAGLPMAIATTTSPVNIAALLRTAIGPDWMRFFPIIEDASTAPQKKPQPQVYLQTLRRLGLPARDCVAFEDSANGLRAATGAGLSTVMTPNEFTSHHDFTGALRVLPTLAGVSLADLRHWLAERG